MSADIFEICLLFLEKKTREGAISAKVELKEVKASRKAA